MAGAHPSLAAKGTCRRPRTGRAAARERDVPPAAQGTRPARATDALPAPCESAVVQLAQVQDDLRQKTHRLVAVLDLLADLRGLLGPQQEQADVLQVLVHGELERILVQLARHV